MGRRLGEDVRQVFSGNAVLVGAHEGVNRPAEQPAGSLGARAKDGGVGAGVLALPVEVAVEALDERVRQSDGVGGRRRGICGVGTWPSLGLTAGSSATLGL